MMKTRILEVVSSLAPAGAENVVSYLASGFDRTRFEPAVVSLYAARPHGLESRLTAHGVPIWHLNKHRGFDPRMFTRLTRIVREFQPHVIHSHCYVLRYLLHISGPLMAHTVHNIATAEVDLFGRMIHRYAFKRGVVPIAVGEAVASSFAHMYGFQPAATIPNGIDLGRFWKPEARSKWRAANGFREDEILIVSTGRLAPQKNPLALANAIANVPNARLLLAGDGVLRPHLEGRERVHLLGIRDDIPDILASADMFALASDWEGLPLAVIEAMAAGLAVVATDVGSVAEAVEHGLTGLLVPARDERKLTSALLALAQDPARRKRMGAAACNRAQSFGVEAMVRAYEKLFMARLAGASGGFHKTAPQTDPPGNRYVPSSECWDHGSGVSRLTTEMNLALANGEPAPGGIQISYRAINKEKYLG
jgi:glycosyltransferase involved in cell wall biosynthesis